MTVISLYRLVTSIFHHHIIHFQLSLTLRYNLDIWSAKVTGLKFWGLEPDLLNCLSYRKLAFDHLFNNWGSLPHLRDIVHRGFRLHLHLSNWSDLSNDVMHYYSGILVSRRVNWVRYIIQYLRICHYLSVTGAPLKSERQIRYYVRKIMAVFNLQVIDHQTFDFLLAQFGEWILLGCIQDQWF